MCNTKRFTAEFKKHVVEEILLPENRKNIILIAEKYGVNQTTVRTWKRLYQEYGDAAFDPKARKDFEKNKLRELEKKVADFEAENEILKKSSGLPGGCRAQVKYVFMH